jgi:nitroreductase
MDINALERIIRQRRSIRRWKKKKVSRERIERALASAIWAPNGGNFQGWHFFVATREALIRKMADAVQSTVDGIAAWPEAARFEAAMIHSKKNASFFRQAPVVIAVCVRQYQSPFEQVLHLRAASDPEAASISSYRRSAPTAIQSAAAAVNTMLLVFHALDLGAVWLGCPLLAKPEIETLISVPENLDMVCLVAVGYPDESPLKQRKPLKEVVTFVE